VVDDGSDSESIRRNQSSCKDAKAKYIFLSENPAYGNPARARNVAYKEATGDVIICQSDDVIHARKDNIEDLVTELQPGTFVIGTVINTDWDGNQYCEPEGKGYGDHLQVYTSPQRKRPLFFLGSLYRSDLYAVGGNDEDFVHPSREDVWFAECLTKGIRLRPHYTSKIVGHHLHHSHCNPQDTLPSREVFKEKMKAAQIGKGRYEAASGPWEYS